MTGQPSHFDKKGNIRMVDVSNKPSTVRMAIAKGEVRMNMHTLQLIQEGNIKKGDVLNTAKISGIMAAKHTSDLIPLCHPLPIEKIDVQIELDVSIPGVAITAMVLTTAKTGVEMEALTAVSIAALTIYDMTKAVEKTMQIQNIRLVEKHGGQSGDVMNES